MGRTVLDQDLDVLDLNTRTKNALRGISVNSVRELVMVDELKIRATRDIGKAALANVKTALARHGLRLGMEREISRMVDEAIERRGR